jgi:hypothetical protein
MTFFKNQHGFSPLIVILAIIVSVGLAGAGYYVWNKNQDDKDTKKPSTSQNKDDDKNEEEKPADPSEGGKYLVIKEWGVRFELPEELRGDILTYKSGTDISGTILFASRKLNKLTGDDTCNFVKQPDGSFAGGIDASISRINPATYPKDALESYKRQLGHIKTIGSYDYYYRKSIESPPITCLTNAHEEFNSVEHSISAQLHQAFKTVEKIE